MRNRKIFQHQFLDIPKLAEESLPDYKGVTRLTRKLSEKAIAEWKERVGEVEAQRKSNYSSRRGDMLHKVVERYLLNQDNLFDDFEKFNKDANETVVMSPNEVTALLFRSIKPILDTRVGVIYGIEQQVYSDSLKIKGMIDITCEFDGYKSIVDNKTKDKTFQEKYNRGFYLQMGCYALCLKELCGMDIERLVIIGAVEGNAPSQVYVKKFSQWENKVLKFLKEYHI